MAMALTKNYVNEIYRTVLVVSALLSTASAVDCHGKSFRCVNSTHFMICVDLGGGVSQAIDNFFIACPPPTICQGTNHFECEFPAPTTPSTTLTNVNISDITLPWEDVVTASSPRNASTEFSENYINTDRITTAAEYVATTDATDVFTDETTSNHNINDSNITEMVPVSATNLTVNNFMRTAEIVPTMPAENVVLTPVESATQIMTESAYFTDAHKEIIENTTRADTDITSTVTEKIIETNTLDSTHIALTITEQLTETTTDIPPELGTVQLFTELPNVIATLSQDKNVKNNNLSIEHPLGDITEVKEKAIVEITHNITATNIDNLSNKANITRNTENLQKKISINTTPRLETFAETTTDKIKRLTTISFTSDKHQNTASINIPQPTKVMNVSKNGAGKNQIILTAFDGSNKSDQKQPINREENKMPLIPTEDDSIQYTSTGTKNHMKDITTTVDELVIEFSKPNPINYDYSEVIVTTDVPTVYAFDRAENRRLHENVNTKLEKDTASITVIEQNSTQPTLLDGTFEHSPSTDQLKTANEERLTTDTTLNIAIDRITEPTNESVNLGGLIKNADYIPSTINDGQSKTPAAEDYSITETPLFTIENVVSTINIEAENVASTNQPTTINEESLTTNSILNSYTETNLAPSPFAVNQDPITTEAMLMPPTINNAQSKTPAPDDYFITESPLFAIENVVSTIDIDAENVTSTNQPTTINEESLTTNSILNIYTETHMVPSPFAVNQDTKTTEAMPMPTTSNITQSKTPAAEDYLITESPLVAIDNVLSTINIEAEKVSSNNQSTTINEESLTTNSILNIYTETNMVSSPFAVNQDTKTTVAMPMPTTNSNAQSNPFPFINNLMTETSDSRIPDNIIFAGNNEDNTDHVMMTEPVNVGMITTESAYTPTIINNPQSLVFEDNNIPWTPLHTAKNTEDSTKGSTDLDIITESVQLSASIFEEHNTKIYTTEAPLPTFKDTVGTINNGASTEGFIVAQSTDIKTKESLYLPTTIETVQSSAPIFEEHSAIEAPTATAINILTTISNEYETKGLMTAKPLDIATITTESVQIPTKFNYNLSSTSVHKDTTGASLPANDNNIAILKNGVSTKGFMIGQSEGLDIITTETMYLPTTVGNAQSIKSTNEENAMDVSKLLSNKNAKPTIVTSTGTNSFMRDSPILDNKFISDARLERAVEFLTDTPVASHRNVFELNNKKLKPSAQGEIRTVEIVTSVPVITEGGPTTTITTNQITPQNSKHTGIQSYGIKSNGSFINESNLSGDYNDTIVAATDINSITEGKKENNPNLNNQTKDSFSDLNSTLQIKEKRPSDKITPNNVESTSHILPSVIAYKDNNLLILTTKNTILETGNTTPESVNEKALSHNADALDTSTFPTSIFDNGAKATKRTSTYSNRKQDKNKTIGVITAPYSELRPSNTKNNDRTDTIIQNTEANSLLDISMYNASASKTPNVSDINVSGTDTTTSSVGAHFVFQQTNKSTEVVISSNKTIKTHTSIEIANPSTISSTNGLLGNISKVNNSSETDLSLHKIPVVKDLVPLHKKIHTNKPTDIFGLPLEPIVDGHKTRVKLGNNTDGSLDNHENMSPKNNRNVSISSFFETRDNKPNVSSSTINDVKIDPSTVFKYLSSMLVTNSSETYNVNETVETVTKGSKVYGEVDTDKPAALLTTTATNTPISTDLISSKQVEINVITTESYRSMVNPISADSRIQANADAGDISSFPGISHSAFGIQKEVPAVGDLNSYTKTRVKLNSSIKPPIYEESTKSHNVQSKNQPNSPNDMTSLKSTEANTLNAITAQIISKTVTTSPIHDVNINIGKYVPNDAAQTFVCISGIRGRYSDKTDCRKFYICVGNNQPIIGKCPENTVFSDFKKLCTKNMSHCIRDNEFKCPSVGRFSDLVKGNIYYICVNHKNHLYRFKFLCQKGYILNKTTVHCVEKKEIQSISISSPNNIRQTASTISSHTSRKSVTSSSSSRTNDSSNNSENTSKTKKSNEVEKSEGDEEDDVFRCKKEGKFPIKKECRRYYLCKKKGKSEYRRKIKKCDSDEVFHKDKKRCVDAESYEC